MAVLARQALILVLFTAALYAIALAAALAVYPPGDGPMDSGAIDRDQGRVFINKARYVVWNRGALQNYRPKAVFVGGSNLQAALRLDILRRSLPGIEVHNLSVGGMNITQMRQVVDLVYEVVPAASRDRLTFVVGISYALFVDDAHHWPGWEGASASRIELEMLRFGLYRKQGGRLEPAVPPRHIPLLGLALRPYFVLARLRYALGWLATGAEPGPPRVMNEAERVKAMGMWWRYMGLPDGRLKDEQFIALVALAQRISAAGSRLVVVDLPLPRWHQQRSPFYQDYQQRKIGFLKAIAARDGMAVVNLQAMDDEADFRDSGHLNAAGADRLSRVLGAALRARLAPGAR